MSEKDGHEGVAYEGEYVISKADLEKLGFGKRWGDRISSLDHIIAGARPHVALTKPDPRGRFSLRRWISKDPDITSWKVFVEDDGRTIRLEAVTE